MSAPRAVAPLIRAFFAQSATVRPVTIWAVVTLLLLLTIACALARRENQSLRDQVSMYQRLAAPSVGRYLPPIAGIDWTGARREVTYGNDQRLTLIYAFSRDCLPCISNWAAMRSVQELSPHRLRIVYLNLVDTLTGDYLREHGIDTAVVFSRLDPEDAIHYEVKGTPQSQLADQSGRVVWSKLGTFRPADITNLVALVEEHEHRSETKGPLQ